MKTCKQSEYKRERGGHKNSEKETKQASKRADRVHYGNNKTDSRSEKHGKRKGDDAKSLAETRSSKHLKASTTEGPQACEEEAHHPSDKKRTGKEKTTQPVSEEDIWEEGMKVKPPKRISINITLEGRKKEGNHEMLCLESSTEKPMEEVQKSGNGGEDKVNEMEFSQEQEGEAKDKISPDEREQSLIWMEDVSDRQDQVREEGETKGGWHCTFRHEEKSTELQEEHDGRKASVKQEETREGRRGGQERRESLPGETAPSETESWVEVKQSMETNAGTRRMSHQDRAETEDSDRLGSCCPNSLCVLPSVNTLNTAVLHGRHGSHGNSLERTWTGGALEQHIQDRASEGEDGLEQVSVQKHLPILCVVLALTFFFTPFYRSLISNVRKKSRMKSPKLSRVCSHYPKWRNRPFPCHTVTQLHLVAQSSLTVVLVEETGRGRWRMTDQCKSRERENNPKRGERRERTTETGGKKDTRGI